MPFKHDIDTLLEKHDPTTQYEGKEGIYSGKSLVRITQEISHIPFGFFMDILIPERGELVMPANPLKMQSKPKEEQSLAIPSRSTRMMEVRAMKGAIW